jgi:NAD-dependent protein deacetylase/lipoamidase
MLSSELVQALRAAKHIVASTGAGISAESGVPTFRDAQTGFWSKFRPEELATPEAFLRDPKMVWDWYAWRRELVARAEPNAGHEALVALEASVPQFTLITQNVDGLHRRAGSREVLELHGNIMQTKCFSEGTLVAEWDDTGETPPRCPACNGLLRPNVVWFGESLPASALAQAFAASRSCDIFLSMGTSTAVAPASSLPFEARTAGALVVEINPDTTPLTPRAHHVLRGAAGEILPLLASTLAAG